MGISKYTFTLDKRAGTLVRWKQDYMTPFALTLGEMLHAVSSRMGRVFLKRHPLHELYLVRTNR